MLDQFDVSSTDTQLVFTLDTAFPGFDLSLAYVENDYWRDTFEVVRPDGTRIGELRSWMTADLPKAGGEIKAVSTRLRDTDLQITKWRGTRASVSRVIPAYRPSRG